MSFSKWIVEQEIKDWKRIQLRHWTPGDGPGGFEVRVLDETGAIESRVFFPECSSCGEPCSEGTYEETGETTTSAEHHSCKRVRIETFHQTKELHESISETLKEVSDE